MSLDAKLLIRFVGRGCKMWKNFVLACESGGRGVSVNRWGLRLTGKKKEHEKREEWVKKSKKRGFGVSGIGRECCVRFEKMNGLGGEKKDWRGKRGRNGKEEMQLCDWPGESFLSFFGGVWRLLKGPLAQKV